VGAPPAVVVTAPHRAGPKDASRDGFLLRRKGQPLFTIFKDYTFSAAHQILGHTRGCQNLHGHNYRVRVHVASETLDRLGMVVDFFDLKQILGAVLDPFDHRVINEVAPFDQRSTSAEELARYVHDEVAGRLGQLISDGRRVTVRRVEVWESESSCAIYEP
jgi:6-pyruvoyltetrahydropterin/6-carboxytetrahydropterin synthase